MIGKNHPALRRVRDLVRDPARRRGEAVFVAEGPRLVREALAASAEIELVVGSPRLLATTEGERLRRAIEEAQLPFLEASAEALDAVQDARSPQPILCVVRTRPVDLEAVLAGATLVVLACGVQDPGNLGAIRRTADAAGADLLLASGSSADLHHPRAVRASSGSVFRLPAARGELGELARALVDRTFRLLGADPRGEVPLAAADFGGRVALVLGAEGAGLPPEIDPLLAARVRIPMRDGVESLSIGAAAAVLLFYRRGLGSGLEDET
jgi:TrmH family RNA methyltransferase